MKIRQFVAAGLLVVAAGLARAAAPMETLDLGDGYQFELIGAGDTPAKVANPKAIFINVALKDDKIHASPAKLIEAADRLFETVLMGAAEKGYYKRATVNIRKPGTAAKPAYEDFVYLRGPNEVWLRQAGSAPWKTAQDPKWTAPETEKIEIAGHGTFAVEMAIEIAAPEGFTRAAEIDFVTKTPVVDIQGKYREIKALWARMDRAKMKADGFDMVLFGNFAQGRRGRFHARKGFFVRIPRATDGDWPELPDRAPDDRDLMISKNELPADELTKTIRQTFASGLDTMRLSEVIAPPLDAAAAPTTAKVGFAEGAPVIKLDPNAFVIKIQ